MPAPSLRTLCLCIKPSPLPLSSGRLSAVGCELPPRQSPLAATLLERLELAENKTTLGSFTATVTAAVKPKSFVCHSYKKHGGGRGGRSHLRSPLAASATRRNARNSNPLIRLLH